MKHGDKSINISSHRVRSVARHPPSVSGIRLWNPVTVEEEGEDADEEEDGVASMAFTLYSLIQTAILCTNAIAVLHEERFLSKSEYRHTFLRHTLSNSSDQQPASSG